MTIDLKVCLALFPLASLVPHHHFVQLFANQHNELMSLVDRTWHHVGCHTRRAIAAIMANTQIIVDFGFLLCALTEMKTSHLLSLGELLLLIVQRRQINNRLTVIVQFPPSCPK